MAFFLASPKKAKQTRTYNKQNKKRQRYTPLVLRWRQSQDLQGVPNNVSFAGSIIGEVTYKQLSSWRGENRHLETGTLSEA